MPETKGTIALMGSGELTATMVEVHKKLLRARGRRARAVFLDTPAGFQLNVDRISARAQAYFQDRVGHPMGVASFKSRGLVAPDEAEQAYRRLDRADYILIGPGSPTYTVRQLQNTPIVRIITQGIEEGGCLTAASAAALTVGTHCLPVYEIYKVGQTPAWIEGLDILGRFGMKLAVIPHWNNAEGGTHDTRFCYMGKTRFEKLEALLPEHVAVLGIDEHTACVMDLGEDTFHVEGIGNVFLKRKDRVLRFEKGRSHRLELLRNFGSDRDAHFPTAGSKSGSKGMRESVEEDETVSTRENDGLPKSFWDRVHETEKRFGQSLSAKDYQAAASAILILDRLIAEARENLEDEEFISQAREILRENLVLLGTHANSHPKSRKDCVEPILNKILSLRDKFREEKNWAVADAIRDVLMDAGVVIEDTPGGSRWELKS